MFQVFSAVKALIEEDGKYLAVIQKVGEKLVYDLPGGRIEYGETPFQALNREVKEEVAVKIQAVKLLGLWSFFRKSDNNQVICPTFLCKITGGKVDIANNPSGLERIKKAEWLSREEMLKNFPDESFKDIINAL